MYQGYNAIKPKQLKCQPLDKMQFNSHAQILYSLCTRPVFQSSAEWVEFKEQVVLLAACLTKYKDYLEIQQKEQEYKQSLNRPVRTVGSDISVEHRPKCASGVSAKYQLFDAAVSDVEPLRNAVVFPN